LALNRVGPVFKGLLASVCFAACGSGESVPELAPAEPQRVLAMDPDRLWIILQASRMREFCGEFYANPSTAPHHAVDCAAWETQTTAWLNANGAPYAEPQDLRSADFWQWYRQKLASIMKCIREVRPPGRFYANLSESAEADRKARSCDPYDQLTVVERRSVKDYGLVAPQVAEGIRNGR
jgi:hypothetical protein